MGTGSLSKRILCAIETGAGARASSGASSIRRTEAVIHIVNERPIDLKSASSSYQMLTHPWEYTCVRAYRAVFAMRDGWVDAEKHLRGTTDARTPAERIKCLVGRGAGVGARPTGLPG